MISNKELEFYKQQGPRTIVKKGVFDDFPDDIDKITRIIRGLLIHPSTIKPLRNLDLPKSRIQKERGFKTVQQILDRANKLDPSPLIIPREPKKRVVAICKHFSMLLCSILREKGIPARTRCGFATYFQGGWFEDHWICEYWNKKQKRWVRVDSQIDDLQAVAYHIDREEIDFLDLPKGVFFPAGVLWKLYREGFIDGRLAGFSDVNGASGGWYVRGNMLRDFFALNEIEYLYSEEDDLMSSNYKPNRRDLKLLDEIARLTVNADENFEKVRRLYLTKKSLRPKKY